MTQPGRELTTYHIGGGQANHFELRNLVYNYVCWYATYLRQSCTEVEEQTKLVPSVPTATDNHAHDRGNQIYN